MGRSVQKPLPPMELQPVDRARSAKSTAVDRDAATRSTDVDRWLELMNRAIDQSEWANKQEALATHMGIDKAYLSRLRSGEKPWRVEHVVGLPDDVEARFERLRAEHLGLIVVEPVHGKAAVENFVSGLFGILATSRIA